MNPGKLAPTRKVTGATLGATIATIVLAIIPGKEDPELAGAIIAASTFIAGWLIPEAS